MQDSKIDLFRATLDSMKSKKEQLHEQIHHEVQQILDSDDDADHKYNMVRWKLKSFAKQGIDSGFEMGQPARGSSRAVYFPKETKTVRLDGQMTKVPYVTKMAYEGEADRYRSHDGDDRLFGEMQNELESDPHVIRSYSVMRHKGGFDYDTNPNGVIPPHFGAHEKHHYLHAGRVEPFNAKDFADATKTHDFPNGITHKDFQESLMRFWDESHGKYNCRTNRVNERMEKLMDHPFVGNAANFVADTDAHPIDFHPDNIGIWHHPITGKKHPVILDYGYSKEIMKKYIDAKFNQRNNSEENQET